MKATVIIGFAEALSAPEVVWSLVDAGFAVVAFTRKGRSPAIRHSRYVRLFEITPPEKDWARALEELSREVARLKNGPGSLAVMPLDDESVWLCGLADFGPAVTVVGPSGDAVDAALNKNKQLELARSAGFAVPPFRPVERKEDILWGEIKYPVVFKPAQATAPQGAGLSKGSSWICSDRAELEMAVASWAEKRPMLLQEFIPGNGEGRFGLATAEGVLAWSGHQRIRMMNPHGSGASACRSVPEVDAASRAAGEKFLKAAGWRGLFMIELLRDTAGKLWFIEFNGRSWGSMALARRSGLEYPAWSVQKALKPDAVLNVPAGQNKKILVCRHLGRETMHLLFVARGAKSRALAKWPSFWSSLFQVMRTGRNDRWYNWRRDDAKVFFSDFYGTLKQQLSKGQH